MMQIADTIPADAVVLEEALTSGYSMPSFLRMRDAQGFYGLASGRIGFANGGRGRHQHRTQGPAGGPIVGDGSAMYSVRAIWIAAHLRLRITYVIPKNRSYRSLKERLPARDGANKFIGMDLRDPEIDFVGLAQSLGVSAQRVSDPTERSCRRCEP
jgi:benzoylformate decarboxylase